MDRAELIRTLATLTPEERAAVLGASSAPASSSPKFSVALDRVADADVPKVVNACRKGLRYVAENPENLNAQDLDTAAVAYVEKVDPVLAQAARNNSTRRGKPYAHSLAVAVTYLQSAEFEAKRAAARRRVPAEPKADKAETPADKAEGGKGGK